MEEQVFLLLEGNSPGCAPLCSTWLWRRDGWSMKIVCNVSLILPAQYSLFFHTSLFYFPSCTKLPKLKKMLHLRHDLWCGCLPFYIQNNKALLAFQMKLILPPFLLLHHPFPPFWEIDLSLLPFTLYKDSHHNSVHLSLAHSISCSGSPS